MVGPSTLQLEKFLLLSFGVILISARMAGSKSIHDLFSSKLALVIFLLVSCSFFPPWLMIVGDKEYETSIQCSGICTIVVLTFEVKGLVALCTCRYSILVG